MSPFKGGTGEEIAQVWKNKRNAYKISPTIERPDCQLSCQQNKERMQLVRVSQISSGTPRHWCRKEKNKEISTNDAAMQMNSEQKGNLNITSPQMGSSLLPSLHAWYTLYGHYPDRSEAYEPGPSITLQW